MEDAIFCKLVGAVIGYSENEYDELLKKCNYEDRDETIEYVLSLLKEREAEVIRLSFIDDQNITLTQLGNKLGVCRERARQIQAMALRKLRHPSRVKYLVYGKSANEARIADTKERIEYLKDHPDSFESYDPREIPVDELMLSNRSINCLRRANINTVLDITNLTHEDLFNIRNIGEQSAQEIIERIEFYGLHLREDVKEK